MNNTNWSLFFDTTELVSGRYQDVALSDAVSAGQVRAFVSSLVIDEFIFRRLRALRSADDSVRTAAKTLNGYVDVTVGTRRTDQELIEAIRAATITTLPEWLRNIPTTNVCLEEILQLSTHRRLPFRGDDNPTGFHDAVILLS